MLSQPWSTFFPQRHYFSSSTTSSCNTSEESEPKEVKKYVIIGNVQNSLQKKALIVNNSELS